MTRARDLADLGSGITSGDLADDSITTAKIAGESVNESKLQVSNAPVNGYMLTAQSGNTGGMTWAEAPTSSTTYGDVGTYVTAMFASNNSTISGGATIAGSSLRQHNDGAGNGILPLKENLTGVEHVSAGLSGTWRQMAPEAAFGTAIDSNKLVGALFLRIS
jgi:hypothetical protein